MDLAYRAYILGVKSDKPFRYLTSEEFLALPPEQRAAYLQKVNDHLAIRTALMSKPEKPPEKKP